jgi:hypothetical protein
MRFRYGLRGFTKPDLSDLAHQARAFRLPRLIWPVTASGQECGSGSINR